MEAAMTKAEISRRKKEARMQAELARVQALRSFEQDVVRRAGGRGLVCGIDEAGRGPLAGPVAAAAVILPEDLLLPWLNDSKKVTPKRREALFDEIREKAVAWSVVMVPPDRIDEINILQATYEAMRTAVGNLSVRPDVLVNDAVTIPGLDILQVPVIKGDARCISIAAASILAKVTRDRYMMEMDAVYPAYGFAGHKGYGTQKHCEAIRACGPCPIHRRSFLKNILGDGPAGDASAGEGPGVRLPDASKRAVGQRGEEAAAAFLRKKGVQILDHGFHGRDGEIDLIGRQEGTLVFFEVKYRTDARFGDPAEAVTAQKQRSICRTALYYMHQKGYDSTTPVRFDVVSLTDRSIRWIRDAFPFRQ